MLGKIVKNFDPSVMYTANPRTVKTDQDLCSFQYQLCYTPFYGSSMYYFQGKKGTTLKVSKVVRSTTIICDIQQVHLQKK